MGFLNNKTVLSVSFCTELKNHKQTKNSKFQKRAKSLVNLGKVMKHLTEELNWKFSLVDSCLPVNDPSLL